VTSRLPIVVTMATEAHADPLATFFRQVWDPAATPESVLAGMREGARQNVAAPGEPLPTAVVFSGERIVGYCSSIPQRLWDGFRERGAYWVKGLMVLPEFRNGPIGYLAVKELSRHLECSTILTVAPAARRLFSALGYSDLGAVRNWVRPIRPGVIADRLDFATLGFGAMPRWVNEGVKMARTMGVASAAGAVAGFAMDAAAWVGRLPGASIDAVASALPVASELDELWTKVRPGLRASPVRDGAHFAFRFDGIGDRPEQDDSPYMFVSSREGGQLVGIAAVRRPRATSDERLGSLRVATISELVFPLDRTDAGLASLGAIESTARRAGADALTCMTSHPTLVNLLRRQGYLPMAGNVHFFVRDVTGAGQWPIDLAQWWLGRGDGESDVSF
jgi:hypothetical protein